MKKNENLNINRVIRTKPHNNLINLNLNINKTDRMNLFKNNKNNLNNR